MDGDGLCQVFGGSCAFRNEDTRAMFMGVRGARNASRFRALFAGVASRSKSWMGVLRRA